MRPIDVPKHYGKFYNWGGIYYYKDQPCEKKQGLIVGNVIDTFGDRAGSFTMYDNGYIAGNTLSGKVYLKVIE